MVPVPVVAGAALALLALWLGLAGWIVAARVRHDRGRRRRARDARLLADGADPGRWSRRRLRRVADGEWVDGAAEAARELVSRDEQTLRRHAREHGFRRSHALRVLTRGGSPSAFSLLRSALVTGSADVRAAVVAIAAEQEAAAADDLLLEVLVAGWHPRSRTATELAPRAARLVPDLLGFAGDPDPEVRYWALMLLRDAPGDPRAKAAAVSAATDESGTVRSAAARVLGATGATDAQHVLRALLGDDVFFVRSHAARAAGEIGAEGLAGDIAALLADRSWWVRAAAKESLLMLGESGLRAAMSMLHDDDGFARDGAREVAAAFRRESPPLELAG
jgi:HEAT repeat protein